MFLINATRIIWHSITCVAARNGAAVVVHTSAGRVFDCGCGYGVMEAYRP